MIFGIGVDMVSISRVSRILERRRNFFIRKIMSDAEWCEWKNSHWYDLSTEKIASKVTKYWAAKEAASKAMGSGFSQGVHWKEIVLTYDELGAPKLAFEGSTSEVAARSGITRYHVSFSDEADQVIAFVLLEAAA